MGNAGGLINDNTYSPTNLGGQKRVAQAQTQSNSPYRGGLQTSFTGDQAGVYQGYWGGGGGTSYGAKSDDPDVLEAQRLTNENWASAHGQNEGVNAAYNNSLINKYATRIGLKNNLSDEINQAPDQLNQAQDQNKLAAGQAVGQGLKNTRENFNSRGLLYSGAREGGEQAVQSAGASQLARSMAGTKQDSENSVKSAKAAYASVDLANQQDTLNRANQAFDTANQNNIARLQAMQQLGSGVGQAVGTIAGSYYNPTPNAPVSPDGSGPTYNPSYNNIHRGLISDSAGF